MLNYIWLALVMLAVTIGGWNKGLKEVTDGAFDGAKTALTIALGLIGIMAMWLGVMRLAGRLGLRAMRDLEKLNRQPGTATNAMCAFLAINTSSVQLIPTTAIAILAAAGSTRPTAFVGTALLA